MKTFISSLFFFAIASHSNISFAKADMSEQTWSGNPPIGCLEALNNDNALMDGFRCRGGYCGTIQMSCSFHGDERREERNDVDNLIQHSAWSQYFSEEQGPFYCDPHWFLTGMSCRGPNCDDRSIKCTRVATRNANLDACKWTGWVSEENGGVLNFQNGFYARGVQCGGRYCDNQRFWICPIA